MLDRNEVVAELLGLIGGAVEHGGERGRDLRLHGGSGHARFGAQVGLGLRPQRFGIAGERSRQLLVEQRQQKVLGGDLGVAVSARQLLGPGNGLLRLQRQLVEVHQLTSE